MFSSRLFFVLGVCLTAMAQDRARPVFEVASVKASQSEAPARLTSNPGMWSCTNCRLFDLVAHAYKVVNYQVAAPDWTKTSTFDVSVKLPEGVAPAAFSVPVDDDPFAVRLRSLLEDRFRMTVHREKRDMPVYEMSEAKGGHKLLPPATAAPEPSGRDIDKDGFPVIASGNGIRVLGDRGRIQFLSQRMVFFALFLSGQLDRPVLDKTGLDGRYALTLSWFRETAVPIVPSPGPSLLEAIQEQLGLKLEQRKGMIEMVVVDRAEKTPIAN